MKTEDNENKKLVMKISIGSIVVNILLSVFKAIAGIVAHSGAMISDAVHSASDVFSTFIVIYGYNASQKKSDKEHPYGHERMECVAAIVLATLLIVVGLGIGMTGVEKIRAGVAGELSAPGVLALWAAVISIVVKEGMFWITRWGAKKVDSDALMADAWHHRTDALSSIGSFVGILGARLGIPVLDPIASLVICIFILKAAIDIFNDAMEKMVDHACDEDTVNEIKNVVLADEDVLGLDMIRTRMFGPKIYVDIDIALPGDMTLLESHRIAERVHDRLEKDFPKIKHCMVHVNPWEESERERGSLNEYESH